MSPFPPVAVRCAAVGALVTLLGACSSFDAVSKRAIGVITPYRIEIVQGNVVTKEMVAAVRPGMGRAQVRDILGTPLLTDIFHPDRWDYVFSIRRPGAAPQGRTVTAVFEGERLLRLEAPDDLPGEREFVAQIDTEKTRPRVSSLALTPEQIEALPKARPVEAGSTLPPITPPTRSYPPLEPGS